MKIIITITRMKIIITITIIPLIKINNHLNIYKVDIIKVINWNNNTYY